LYIYRINSENKKANLNSKVARLNLKKLGEKKNNSWIMLVNSTIRANLTLF